MRTAGRLWGVLVVVLLALALGVGSLPTGASASPTYRCQQLRVEGAAESHVATFKTECNFRQARIRILPLEANVIFVHGRPEIDRKDDPGDKMRCGRHADPSRMVCGGTAGMGARVTGFLEVNRIACDVGFRIRVEGGIDCDRGEVCPDIGLTDTRSVSRPAAC